MIDFKRKINLPHPEKLGNDIHPRLDDLFRLWTPAGRPSRERAARSLRFVIRNKYANFYADGPFAPGGWAGIQVDV